MLQRKCSPVIIAFLLIAVLLSACGGPQPAKNSASSNKVEPRGTGKSGGKISYRLTSAPKTLNYLLAEDEPSIIASLFFLTSRLVEFNHETQKFVPGLAETWTTAADGMTVDIKLRDGLKFSDGQPLRTDDVIFTLNAMYDERTKSPAFRDAMLIDDKPIASKRLSDTQMQLIFPKPVASVENYLTNLGVLPAHVLEPEQKAGKLAESWKVSSEPSSIVSSGPFVVAAVTPGERIEFARNPNYWRKDSAGNQLPYLDGISLEVVADPNNTLGRLGQGSLDMADRLRASDFSEISKQGGSVRAIDVGPGLGIDHIWFNLNENDGTGKTLNNGVKRAWFSEKRFREAVAHAVDRETIASVTLQGLASPLYGFVSPTNKIWLSADLPKISYDLAKSQQLLTEAGFKKNGDVLTDAQNNPVEFTLIVPTENEPRKLMAAVIQEDLAKLGIKMQVAPIEFPAVTDRWMKNYDYDAVLLGLSQTDTEPSSYSNFLLSSAATHQWRPKQKTPATEWEAKIDKLFAEQSVERDPSKRLSEFSEIQKVIAEELPVIPIVSRHVVSASNSRIGNYSPSGILPYSLWDVDEIFIK